jgi:hypothetical protein
LGFGRSTVGAENKAQTHDPCITNALHYGPTPALSKARDGTKRANKFSKIWNFKILRDFLIT